MPKYPEVPVWDTTYNVNNCKMPPASGNGPFVTHGLLFKKGRRGNL